MGIRRQIYLSTLKLWNFKKHGIIREAFESSSPDLEINFKNGVNVLIRVTGQSISMKKRSFKMNLMEI